jgi:hypothetical protein
MERMGWKRATDLHAQTAEDATLYGEYTRQFEPNQKYDYNLEFGVFGIWDKDYFGSPDPRRR